MALHEHILAFDGTIDSDYTGELTVVLHNAGKRSVKIDVGDRVGQLIIIRIHESQEIEGVIDLPQTIRGSNGFGSRGKRSL